MFFSEFHDFHLLFLHTYICIITLSISASMGVYTYYTMYNNRPAYHCSKSGRQLYFLANSRSWLVGPSLGSPTGYLHNGNISYQCPYLIPDGWMFVNSGYWYNDQTLVVRCIYWIMYCWIIAIVYTTLYNRKCALIIQHLWPLSLSILSLQKHYERSEIR